MAGSQQLLWLLQQTLSSIGRGTCSITNPWERLSPDDLRDQEGITASGVKGLSLTQAKSALDLPFPTPFENVFMGEGLYCQCTWRPRCQQLQWEQGALGPMELQCEQNTHGLNMDVCAITCKYQNGIAVKQDESIGRQV